MKLKRKWFLEEKQHVSNYWKKIKVSNSFTDKIWPGSTKINECSSAEIRNYDQSLNVKGGAADVQVVLWPKCFCYLIKNLSQTHNMFLQFSYFHLLIFLKLSLSQDLWPFHEWVVPQFARNKLMTKKMEEKTAIESHTHTITNFFFLVSHGAHAKFINFKNASA